MPETGENKAVTAAAAVAVALAAGVALMQVRDPWLLVPWMLVAVLAVQPGRIVPRKVTWIDGAMAAVWVWSLAQMALTVNPLPTLFMALMQTAAMAAYLLARRTRPGALTAGVAAAGTVAALIVAGSFVVFRRNVLAAGFGSVYDFRFLFHPMHIHCNMLASAMLACSGVVIAGMPEKHRGWRIAAAALMWMAVALTFSRGAWLAMAVTWVGLMIGVRPLRVKLGIGVALLAAVLAVAAACPAETRTALSMASTQSQQLSTRARVDGASASAEAFAARPLRGYGPGNYSLAIDRFTPDDSSAAYSSIPPNAMSALAVEQGATGLLIWAVLAVAVAGTLWRFRRRRASAVGAAVIAGLCVKEMTQCSLWSSSGTMLMLALLLALIQPQAHYGGRRRLRAGYAVLAVTVATLAAGLAVRSGLLLLHAPGTEQLHRGIGALTRYHADGNRAHLDTADVALDRAAREMPYDRIPAQMHAAARWLRTGDPAALLGAAARSPRNHTLRFLAARACLSVRDTAAAIEHLAAAVRLAPRLTGDGFVDSLLRTRSVGPVLRGSILARAPGPDASAGEKARYGFLLHRFGMLPQAEAMLREAVAVMPSLATPWRRLGEMAEARHDGAAARDCRKRYEVITRGAFSAQSDSASDLSAEMAVPALWTRERAILASRYGL